MCFILVTLNLTKAEAQKIDSTWMRIKQFVGQPMQPVNGIIITGQKIDSNYFKNHVVLLNFANLINVGSLTQVAFLNRIHDDFEGKPVKILSVIPNSVQDVKDFNSDNNPQAQATALRKSFGIPTMNYDVLATCNIQRPPDVPLGVACDTIIKDYLIGGYPTTCVIDAGGIIRYVHIGFAPKEQQEAWLAKVEKQINVLLQAIPSGASYVIDNIFFEPNSFALRDESKTSLDQLVDLLKQNPSLKIQIGGYTDDQGSEEYNQVLSENRAKSVYDYLLKNRIESSRVSYKGYGESNPIAPNTTEEGRAQNRRIEFKVISN